MEDRHDSGRRDLEHRTVEIRAAARGCAIEIPVAALNQRAEWANSIVTGERKDCRDTGRCDLEHRAGAGRAAARGCAIEIPIAALNQSGAGKTPVGGTSREGMQYCLHACEGDLEHRTELARAAGIRCAVEISVTALNDICPGANAVCIRIKGIDL